MTIAEFPTTVLAAGHARDKSFAIMRGNPIRVRRMGGVPTARANRLAGARAEAVVDRLLSLIEACGGGWCSSERINEAAHSVQCAALVGPRAGRT